jgi:hypothetical protein
MYTLNMIDPYLHPLPASPLIVRDTVSRIFDGLKDTVHSSQPLMPVLYVDKPLYEAMMLLSGTKASIQPSSLRKIDQCKTLFDKHIDANMLMGALHNYGLSQTTRVTPKLFQYTINNACLSNPQRIVLPEVRPATYLTVSPVPTDRTGSSRPLGQPHSSLISALLPEFVI